MITPFPFPRQNDGLGYAWGLNGKTPQEISERFSPCYEAQAEDIWRAFERMGWVPELAWAGSEDGEAIIARNQNGEMIVLYHLEDPAEAKLLQEARQRNGLEEFIRESHEAIKAEAACYSLPDQDNQ